MQKDSSYMVKVALITGAARRIGAQTAALLHSKGMNVVLHYNTSASEVLKLSTELNLIRPQSAVVVQADLKNIAALTALMDQAVAAWGHLDVLVNNASLFYKTTMGEIKEADWDELMSANVKAPLFLSQLAVPHLTAQHGCIVNITDIHGERPMRDYSVYCLTKAALIMLTKQLAKELGPYIRVNAISPGAIVWPEGDNVLSSESKAKIIDKIALAKHGDPAAIAKAVWYFINDADYVTGQILAVDGGRLLNA